MYNILNCSGVDMISERGDKNTTKWEGKIRKPPTLSKLFTRVIKTNGLLVNCFYIK